MRIGLVGKPNVGKSTFFAASTLIPVDIANYPFCTIEPNVGFSFIPSRQPCPCGALRKRLEEDGRAKLSDDRGGSICLPRTGSCEGHQRYVPCMLVDVAGLVPGASQGRGRGNAFLSDLAECDALIQVIDVAGTTDIEGNPTGMKATKEQAIEQALAEVEFLTAELDAWILGLIKDGWSRGARRIQAEGVKGFTQFLQERLSGLGATDLICQRSFDAFAQEHRDMTSPWDWSDDVLMLLAAFIRKHLFPIFIAGNKADLAPEGVLEHLQSVLPTFTPCSAETELALRQAGKAGFITYLIGDTTFKLREDQPMNEAQQKGLSVLAERVEKLRGTGLSKLLDQVLFDELQRIVVYPVQDESQWTDGDGNVLPDALVVQDGIQAKQVAYKVHSDLGDGFIKAVDGRTRRIVGADHELSDGDVLRIHSK
ncbi:MAG: Ribosome-binding ATPase YchF [Candidatus Poseidoniaceae archaeon]|nr:MAG: Ribosome-binding ATPase YchF [Candidatus Poseidoniaceae archaeon]